MDEVEVKEQLTPIKQEAAFLQFLKDNWTTNPKKLKKLAAREAKNHSAEAILGLISSIALSRDPVAYVLECFRQAEVYPQIIAEFIEQGDHGMIVVNDVVSPVRIQANPRWLRENDRWNPDDEIDIQHRLIETWMIENNVSRFKGKIALFPFFGFSGYFRRIRKQRILGKFIDG
jgi:hypothetical protein